MNQFKFFVNLLLAVMLLLSSCSIRPSKDYAARTIADIKEVPVWQKMAGSEKITNLFNLLSSTELEKLVKEALAANPGLQQIFLSLQILQAQRRQTAGAKLPQAAAGLSAGKTEGNDSSYTGAISLSLELDPWGKLTEDEEAAAMDVAAQAALLQRGRDSLAAEVMKAWLAIIANRHAIDIEERRLATLQQNEGYILQRYRNGLGELEDLDSARSTTASSRATIVEYRESMARQQRTLQRLLGRSSKSTILTTVDYPVVLTPLADLPEQTLARRPDLQAAYYAIVAADLRSSVAYKELLPSISLEAALQDIQDSPDSFFLTDPVWSLLAQLTAPIYKGGSLKAAAMAAELRTALNYQAYRESLLIAVTEVENTLGRELELEKRIGHIQAALTSARNSLTSYRRSYRTGLVNILGLLIVQQETYNLEIQLDNLIYEQLANRIDLGLALGIGVTQ